MKKRISFILLCVISAFSLFCFNAQITNKKTYAQETQSEIIQNDIQGIVDNNLYNSLLWNNYNKFLPAEQREIYITKDMFKNVETLNLESSAISSLLGLNLLNLENLKSINLSDNNISIINPQVAQSLSHIQTLNLSTNNLKSIDLSYFTNLNDLDLSNNKLSEIDLSGLVENNAIINVNLQNNNFSSATKINVHANKNYNLNLIYNKFTSSADIPNLNNVNVDAYFQNLLSTTLTTGQAIKIFGGLSIQNFNIKVKNANQEIIQILTKNTNTYLPVGTYTLCFYNDQTALYNAEDISTYAFNDIQLNIIPQSPQYEFYSDNKKIEEVPSTLRFASAIKLKLFSPDNAAIKVSINNGNYQKINELEILNDGAYKINIVAEQNGIQSTTETLYIIINSQSSLPVSVVVILSLCGLFLVLVALKIYSKSNVNFNKKKETND